MLNEKLTDYLPGKGNSAADQAKKQGLTSVGWGRWANAQGKVVAKSVDGRLQKVDVNMGQQDPKNRNPKTKPINPAARASDPANVKEKIRWAAGVKVKQAYKNPEVQKAARSGTEFTGQQMTNLTGIPEKAFAAGHSGLSNGEIKILGLSDVGNSSDTIHYNPQTKKYKFVSDKYLSKEQPNEVPTKSTKVDDDEDVRADRQRIDREDEKEEEELRRWDDDDIEENTTLKEDTIRLMNLLNELPTGK